MPMFDGGWSISSLERNAAFSNLSPEFSPCYTLCQGFCQPQTSMKSLGSNRGRRVGSHLYSQASHKGLWLPIGTWVFSLIPTLSSDFIVDFVLKASFWQVLFSHMGHIRMCTYLFVTTVVLIYGQAHGFKFHVCRRVFLNSGVTDLSKAQYSFQLFCANA